jgi:hypothetical protein
MIDVMSETSFKYLTGHKGEHFPELIEDAIYLTKTHLNPWDIDLEKERVTGKADPQSYWSVFKALNECYAEAEGKQHWFSKEPSLFKHIYALALHFPEAEFIFMVRDPRDVVASMLKGKLHAQNAYTAACKWRNEQRLCLNAYTDPLLKNRITLVKYEDLITDTDNLVRNLMQQLGIDFESQQLEFHQNEKVIAHAKKSEFWSNLAQPVDSENKEKYNDILSCRQIRLIENICGAEMRALEYPVKGDVKISVPAYARGFYRLHELVMKRVSARRFSEEARKHRTRKQKVAEIRNRSFD